jgi:hypothetical protein
MVTRQFCEYVPTVQFQLHHDKKETSLQSMWDGKLPGWIKREVWEEWIERVLYLSSSPPQIFCADCSGYFAPLKYKSNKPGRVCQTCFEKLTCKKLQPCMCEHVLVHLYWIL